MSHVRLVSSSKRLSEVSVGWGWVKCEQPLTGLNSTARLNDSFQGLSVKMTGNFLIIIYFRFILSFNGPVRACGAIIIPQRPRMTLKSILILMAGIPVEPNNLLENL